MNVDVENIVPIFLRLRRLLIILKTTPLEQKQRVLLLTAPLLCLSMGVLFPILTNVMGKTVGYVTAFCIYWFVFCVPVSVYSATGFAGLRKIYSLRSNLSSKTNMIYYLLAFVPCLATFLVVFRAVAPVAGYQVLLLSALFALINGVCEELFWRGAFNLVFKDLFRAYIYPSVSFGIWHIALLGASGVKYQGGFAPLVGGALFMGLLWGWVAYQTKSIKVVTVAHVITNFFAFTGLIFTNWFA